MSPYRTPPYVHGDRKRPRYELLAGAALAFVVWWSGTSLTIQALRLVRLAAVDGLAALPPSPIKRPLVVAPSPPRPRPDESPPAAACDALAPFLLSDMVPKTRDPRIVIERAKALAAAGMRIRIVNVAEPVSAGQALGFRGEPVRCGARTLGLQVRASRPDAAAKWGLLEGDLIVAVNGHPIDRPEHAIDAYATAKREKVAVVEVTRADVKVVIVLPLDEA